MTRARLALALATLMVAGPALAVGLGPLTKEGLTDTDQKGFYLTLINPYPEPEQFTTAAIGLEDETHADRVSVIPADARLGGGRDMRLLVIARDLRPGETYKFRVCAQRAQPPAGVLINARVCSKLTARRLPAAAGNSDPGAG